MSKSTNRYGKILFSARNTGDGAVTPSKKLQRQFAKLERAAQTAHGKPYDSLTDAQKIELHYQINIANDKARHEAETKAMSDEAEIGLEDEQ